MVELVNLCGESLDALLIVVRVERFEVLFDDGEFGFLGRRFAEVFVGDVQQALALLATFDPTGPLDESFVVGGAPFREESGEPRADLPQTACGVRRFAAMVLEVAPRAAVFVADDAQRFQLAVPRRQHVENRLAVDVASPGPASRFGHPRVERFHPPVVMVMLVAGRLPGPQVVAGFGGPVPRVNRVVDFDCLGVAEVLEELAPTLPLGAQVALHALTARAEFGEPTPPRTEAAFRAVPAFEFPQPGNRLPMQLGVVRGSCLCF